MPTPRITIDELPEQTEPEPTNLIVVQDSGISKKMSISVFATQVDLDALAARVAALEAPTP
jgi:hypothetical protein